MSQHAFTRCTMAVIGKKCTADGSILIWHNEELMSTTPQRLAIIPRKNHKPEEKRACGFEIIPQVPVTYGRIGDKYWPGGYPPGDWCTGLNEHGVTLVSNAQKSRENPLPPDKGVSFCDMTEVAAERARTPLEAVETLGWLIDSYGVAGPFPNNCWIAANQDEAWYVEASARHWVARKIGDHEILPISNRFLIGSEWDLGSKDLVDSAMIQGWYEPLKGKPFIWKDVYGLPERQDSAWLINREARIRRALEPKKGAISLKNIFQIMRDHYENTDLYSYPPHQASENLLPLCSGSSVFGVVYHMRPWLPVEIGAMMWHRMAAACSSVHIPIYLGTTGLPDVYTMDLTDQNDPVSAWWRYKSLMDEVDKDYQSRNPPVRKAWQTLEEEYLREASLVENKALEAYKNQDTDLMKKVLTRHSMNCLTTAYNTARKFNVEDLFQSKISGQEM